MIKHGLIRDRAHLEELEKFSFDANDWRMMEQMIRHSVEIKKYFVESDPQEKNIRKALNFGHTTGHALESLVLEQQQPLLHGYAVAWGMAAELWLSARKCGFPVPEMERIASWIKSLYGKCPAERNDFRKLTEIMLHDKKNEGNRVNFTLLSEPGRCLIDQYCTLQEIMESLEYLHQL